MIPKVLLSCLLLFWSFFLCANLFVYFGWFGSAVAYPTLFFLVLLLIFSWGCLFQHIYKTIKPSGHFFLYALLLTTTSALFVFAYAKWCLNPSENILAAFDSGMYFTAAAHISNEGSHIMQANWPSHAPESLKEWWLGQNPAEAQRRDGSPPKYWNFVVGYFFLDQHERSGAIAIPFPNGHPTLLASALTVGGPRLAFHLNTIIHFTASALFGLLAIQFLKKAQAGIAALLMLFFPLSVWSANHLYAEPLLILAWLSSILAWSYRDKMPGIAGILTSVGPGLGLLIKIDALLGALSLILLLFEFRKRTRFAWSAVASFATCAIWATYSNTSFTGNYIKDTIYALWETSPMFQYPKITTFILLFLILIVLTVINRKPIGKYLRASQKIHSFTGDRNLVLKCIPWILMAIFAYLYFIRPNPICPDTFVFTASGKEIRSYREDTFLRLSWFFSPIVLWISLIGSSLMILRIKKSWQIALYGCGLFCLLFFAYDIRCNPTQPYCMRRFATYTNPLLLLGIVSGLTTLFEYKKMKATAFLLTPLLILTTALFFTKGVKIHKVSEMEGLYSEVNALAQKLPDDGILLIPKRSFLSNFSALLRFVFGKEVFNVESDKNSDDYILAMQAYLSTSPKPVYLLSTSRVDCLGLPEKNQELITDGFLNINYAIRNYKDPYYKEKEVKIHYYLFELPTGTSGQDTI